MEDGDVEDVGFGGEGGEKGGSGDGDGAGGVNKTAIFPATSRA